MTSAQILLEIAGLAAGAIGRHLAPATAAKTTTAIKKTTTAIKKATTAVKPAPAKITMYDAVTVTNIPTTAAAVAGYANGLYVTVPELRKRFPHAHLLTIAVNDQALADCLDVETGDATPAQAPAWVKRQLKEGVPKRPCVYANRSTMPTVWAALQAAGIKRDQVRLWCADWTSTPHIPASYDACQYKGGITAPYDESLCLPNFFT